VHTFVLMLVIVSFGAVSGGHVNPAVTVAQALLRRIGPLDALTYIFMQLAGAVAGALVCKLILPDIGRPVDYGATVIAPSFLGDKVFIAVLVEAIGAFGLMWAIMATMVSKNARRDWAGLVIGSALGLGVLVFAPLTGASFNPARSFGPALVSGNFSDYWVYVVGPVIGMIIAAFGYRALMELQVEQGQGKDTSAE
jgi:MIP family channel proteins